MKHYIITSYIFLKCICQPSPCPVFVQLNGKGAGWYEVPGKIPEVKSIVKMLKDSSLVFNNDTLRLSNRDCCGIKQQNP